MQPERARQLERDSGDAHFDGGAGNLDDYHLARLPFQELGDALVH